MTQLADRRAPGPAAMLPPTLAELRPALTAETLTADERALVAEQLTLLLAKIFVHRHQKKALYGVDVSRRLTLLRRKARDMSDAAFHDEICDIVDDLRDSHTSYTVPGPRSRSIAVLNPFFLVERCWIEEEERWAWLATHVAAEPGEALTTGAEITHWNGTPIDLAVARNADRVPGNSDAAHRAQGAAALTVRGLGTGPLPDEDRVVVDFVADGRPGRTTAPWVVLEIPTPPEPDPAGPRAAVAVNERQRRLRDAVGRRVAGGEGRTRRSGDVTAVPIDTDVPLTAAWEVTTPSGTFGHLRIFGFLPGDPTDPELEAKILAMYEGLVALLDRMPRTGLVLDLRGNAGGSLFVAEMLLQHLTPGTIEPTPFQLAVADETVGLSRANPFYERFGPSLAQGLDTGAQYSAALPYSRPYAVNYFGQTYFGPVVLVTDALCFSASDLFAAAFQSHGMGPILGCDDTTGAAGANVEVHEQLRKSWPDSPANPSPLRPLPAGVAMTVAVGRILRLGDQAGQPLEDLGVTPTRRHAITRRDLLEDNADLLLHATRLLADAPLARLDVTTDTVGDRVVLTVTTAHLDSVDVYLDGRPVARRAVEAAGGAVVDLGTVDLDEVRSTTAPKLRVEGFRGPVLAAARTVNPPADLTRIWTG